MLELFEKLSWFKVSFHDIIHSGEQVVNLGCAFKRKHVVSIRMYWPFPRKNVNNNFLSVPFDGHSNNLVHILYKGPST